MLDLQDISESIIELMIGSNCYKQPLAPLESAILILCWSYHSLYINEGVKNI